MSTPELPPVSPEPAMEASIVREPFWRARWFVPALAGVVVVLIVVVAGLAWRVGSDLGWTQREFARRIADADAKATSAVQTSREAANALMDANKQLAVLEARLSESQSQQGQLEQMYQELTRSRDEVQLADIEQALTTAAQQLQLSGNVASAILTLQSVDGRLAKATKPQFLAVRRSLARDLERLRALPATDISGMAVRLDQAIAQLDTMPTMIDERPAPMAAKAATKANEKPVEPPSRWAQLGERLGNELRSLVRIREVGSPEVILLTPSQAYFLRENLKLRLLNARLQLLARNESGFRTDVQAALDMMTKYFDARARQTQGVQAQLRQLLAAQVSVDLPNLSDSLGAVRNFRP